MKRLVLVLVILPCVLLAVRLKDYDVDKSSVQALSGGVNYHFGMTSGEVVSHFGNFSLNFESLRSTLPSSFDINFFGNLNGNFLKMEEDTSAADTSDTGTVDAVKQVNYQVQWEAKYNKYFISGKDFLGFVKLDGDAATDYDLPATRATIGIGLGRFVNATPLARAIRMEEEMLAEGVLIDSLPIGALLNFAKALSPESMKEYKAKYYYWEKEYYSSLESMLRSSNLLHNSELGSVGSLIVKDILEEYMSPRYYGYEVNLGVGYDLIPAYKEPGRAAFASLGFDFAQPFGLRTQFIEKSNLRLPFTGGQFGKAAHGSLLLSLSYELSSTIDLIGAYQLKLDRVIPEGDTDYSMVLHNQLRGTFAYLIVDRLVMSNTITINQSSQIEGLSAEFSSTISFRFF